MSFGAEAVGEGRRGKLRRPCARVAFGGLGCGLASDQSSSAGSFRLTWIAIVHGSARGAAEQRFQLVDGALVGSRLKSSGPGEAASKPLSAPAGGWASMPQRCMKTTGRAARRRWRGSRRSETVAARAAARGRVARPSANLGKLTPMTARCREVVGELPGCSPAVGQPTPARSDACRRRACRHGQRRAGRAGVGLTRRLSGAWPRRRV